MGLSVDDKNYIEKMITLIGNEIQSLKNDIKLQISQLKETFDKNLDLAKETLTTKIKPLQETMKNYREDLLDIYKRLGCTEKDIEKLKTRQGNDEKASDRRAKLITGIIGGLVVSIVMFLIGKFS